ncbi:tetratricopeptide-like helical domain-containing protein (TPR) [Tieghemostelium lacteum]|uniref:Tetratricopeptide-like helical domain-containing protein (TPR) n=1 Tax=Tieghemostelium lacteum TaxID=361077 RepID=A0A151Z8J0_TIELA|nr:tetratricopeptide-like helical domain-containing protein (TPR) [Tieghemostelium lacteum]|eukprot:KYQ90257.1 tetratricopeptide-like helical domain-containing protein (TPR) [Tieghemostelium lacteum]
MSDIKSLLKEAKESIDKKDYEKAVETCLNALEYDDKNYNIHLFLGLSYCNLDNYNQSEKYYLSALKIQSTSPFPLRGLIELYGKTKENDKLYNILQQLIPLTSDNIKKRELQVRLVDVMIETQKYTEARDLITSTLSVDDELMYFKLELVSELDRSQRIKLNVESKMKEKGIPIINPAKAHVIGAPTHTPEQKIQKEQIEAQIESQELKGIDLQLYNRLLNDIPLDKVDKSVIVRVYRNYIKNLQLLKRYSSTTDELLKYSGSLDQICEKMSGYFKSGEDDENHFYPLEIQFEQMEENQSSIEALENLTQKLSTRAMGLIGSAYTKVMKLKDYSESTKADLDKGIHLVPQTILGNKALAMWYLKSNVSESFEKLRAVVSRTVQIIQSKERLRSTGSPCYSKLLIDVELLMVRGLIKNSDFDQALKNLNQLLIKFPNQPQVLYRLAKVHFQLKNLEKSKETLDLLALKGSTSKVMVLLAWINCLLNLDLQQSMDMLNDIVTGEEHYLLLYVKALLVEKLLKSTSEALQLFLKSAKLNSSFSWTFSNLGRLYSSVDSERSKKCFQRAIALDPLNRDAGLALAEIYLGNGQGSLAFSLYNEITEHCLANRKSFPFTIVDCHWAFYRLALHQMDNGQLDQSVTSFLNAIKGSPNDSLYWRGLGEAYKRQTKYIAALKTLEKANQLVSTPIPELNFQLASLNKILGLFKDTVLEFDRVLLEIPNHIPTLKGKAESLFYLAKEYTKEKSYRLALDSLISAQESVQLAIKTAVSAVEKPPVECLYKLCGDIACYFVNLPSESDEKRRFSTMDKLKLAAESYLEILKINSYNHHNLQDLALCFYMQSQRQPKDENLLRQSIKFCCQALNMEPCDDRLWNLLGIILMDQYPQQSQHALIKSIQLDSTKAETYNNLALLYLRYGLISQCDHSLIIAKSNDSSSCVSWSIQGLIHELQTGISDSQFDYSHCSIALESNPIGEGLLGYGLVTLAQGSYETSYSILYKYLELYPNSIDGNLYYSLVLENLCNHKESEIYLLKTLGLLSKVTNGNSVPLFDIQSSSISNLKYHDNIIVTEDRSKPNVSKYITLNDKIKYTTISLSRVQCKLGKYKESVDGLLSLKVEDNSMIWEILANCYYFMSKFDHSLQATKKSIQYNQNSQKKLDLNLMLAKVTYDKLMCSSSTSTNDMVSQITSLLKDNNTHQESILFLTGVLISVRLYDKAIETITSYQLTQPTPSIETYELLSKAYLLSGKVQKAREQLLKSCHLYPHVSKTWVSLSEFQLHYCPSSENVDHLPRKLLEFQGNVDSDLKRLVTLAQCYMVETTSPFIGNLEKSIQVYQKLIHYHPESLWLFYCLQNAYYCKSLYTNSVDDYKSTKAAMSILNSGNSDTVSQFNEKIKDFKFHQSLITLDILLSENQKDQYKKLWDQLKDTEKSPENLSTLYRSQSKFHLINGQDYKSALNSLKESIRISSKNIQSFYEMSWIYEKQDLLDASLLCLQKALELLNQSTASTNTLTLISNTVSRISRILIVHNRKYKEAIKLIDSIPSSNQDSVLLVLKGIATLLSNNNSNNIKQYTNDMKSAEKNLLDSISLNNRLSLANYYLINTNLNLKQYQSLQKYVEQELKNSPSLVKEITIIEDKLKQLTQTTTSQSK